MLKKLPIDIKHLLVSYFILYYDDFASLSQIDEIFKALISNITITLSLRIPISTQFREMLTKREDPSGKAHFSYTTPDRITSNIIPIVIPDDDLYPESRQSVCRGYTKHFYSASPVDLTLSKEERLRIKTEIMPQYIPHELIQTLAKRFRVLVIDVHDYEHTFNTSLVLECLPDYVFADNRTCASDPKTIEDALIRRQGNSNRRFQSRRMISHVNFVSPMSTWLYLTVNDFPEDIYRCETYDFESARYCTSMHHIGEPISAPSLGYYTHLLQPLLPVSHHMPFDYWDKSKTLNIQTLGDAYKYRRCSKCRRGHRPAWNALRDHHQPFTDINGIGHISYFNDWGEATRPLKFWDLHRFNKATCKIEEIAPNGYADQIHEEMLKFERLKTSLDIVLVRNLSHDSYCIITPIYGPLTRTETFIDSIGSCMISLFDTIHSNLFSRKAPADPQELQRKLDRFERSNDKLLEEYLSQIPQIITEQTGNPTNPRWNRDALESWINGNCNQFEINRCVPISTWETDPRLVAGFQRKSESLRSEFRPQTPRLQSRSLRVRRAEEYIQFLVGLIKEDVGKQNVEVIRFRRFNNTDDFKTLVEEAMEWQDEISGVEFDLRW